MELGTSRTSVGTFFFSNVNQRRRLSASVQNEERKGEILANFVDGTDKSALVKRARHATRNKTRAKPTKEPSTNTLLIVYSIPLRTDLSTLFTLQKRTKIILTRCYVV